MKICCVFLLEWPHRGNSNEYTQYTIFSIKKKLILNYPKSAATGFSKGLKNELVTAVVNESSVFEPLKLYCTCTVPEKSAKGVPNYFILQIAVYHLLVWDINVSVINYSGLIIQGFQD